MFTLSHVTYQYGDTPLLTDVCAQFAADKISVILGENGSGKSTIARLCMGILRDYRGNITCNGQDVRALQPHQIAKSVYYMMQNPARQLFCESVAEEVAFALPYRGKPAVDVLPQWRLSHLAQAHPLTLSGGEVQRLALAVGCALSPDYLLLDEPTSNLDAQAVQTLQSHLRAQAQQGKGCLLITHDTAFAHAVADQRYTLQEGRLCREL